ncbi:MAG: DUF4402 domain-containing protein [Gammaproteobacteria bacterium]|nr:DUF4402 domain-containing protein [Gammaproteobacteria bacterium]
MFSIKGRGRHALSLFLLWLLTGVSAAETITEVNRLSFGKIVVLDNSEVSTVTIYADGRQPKSSGDIVILDEGTHAIYQLFDFPPLQVVSIRVTGGIMYTGVLGGSKGNFTLSDFTLPGTVGGEINPPTARTDANGDLTLLIGATFSTSGDGRTYYDGDYSATVDILVTY